MSLPARTLATGLPARYRILGVLGEGGTGVVFDAFDEQRGHRVALKTLKQPSPESIYRLKREFRVLSDISHPGLVQLYDLVVANKATAFSMEVVDGTDFIAHARRQDSRRGPRTPVDDSVSGETTLPALDLVAPGQSHVRVRAGFDEDRLRRTLPQLVAALRRLHEAGVVHRDVKPSNALVTPEGRVVVLDFGLAANRASAEAESMQGLIGTLAYMSPEQAAEASEVGPATDWYAVGAMLYEALTGRLPHTGKFVDVLIAKRTQVPPPPSTLVREVPPDLEDLCMRLLAIQPEARPGGAEIADALGVRERPAISPDATLAPRFTGRVAELARVEHAVGVARGGRPSLAWVRGPSGIGKTALVSEALARIQAAHRDAVILRGRCYEQELVPFKAIDGLIDGLSRMWRRLPDADAAAIAPRAASALQRLFPVLARVAAVAEAPPMAESRDPLEVRARAFGALRELLQRLADRRLVVMYLDDLQWVDADTLRLLEEVLCPPDAPRLVLLVSSRSDVPAAALEEAIARMDLEVTTIDLGPLDADEARGLVRGLLGDGASDLADRVVREAEGSPFFLGELVRYLQTVGDDGAVVSIADVVRRRISLLPASARHLLELIAIAGEPLRLRELAAAAGLEPEQVARDLRVLRVDHLVRAPGGHGDDHVEPYHDRIRAAILDLLDDDTRRKHHRALATALGTEVSPARLARHWAGAGDRPRAASYARQAGDAATATFDFEHACDLYRMALELGDHDAATRRELQILRGGALRDAGRSPEAGDTFLAAAEGADPMQRLELRRRAAEQLLSAGMIERGTDVLRAVLAEIGEELPRTSGRAVTGFLWNHLRLSLGGSGWKTRDVSEIPPRELFRLDCYITVGLTLTMVDTMVGGMYLAKGLVVARRLGEPKRLFRVMALYVAFLMSPGGRMQRRGRKMLPACARLAEQIGGPYERALLTTTEGFGAYFEGDFDRSAATLAQAERVYVEDTVGSHYEINSSRQIMCQSLRHQGRFTELRERVEAYVRDAHLRGDQFTVTTMHRAFNQCFLAGDDVAGARNALASVRWSPPERGIHLQHCYELRAAVDLALYTGELDRADLERQMAVVGTSRLMRVQSVRAETRWMRLRLALAFGLGGWDPHQELARLRRERLPQSSVWAALGEAALATGAARVARLRAAAELADRHRMYAAAEAARWRLGEALGGDAGAAQIAGARTKLVELGIEAPERMVEVLAPGFTPRRALPDA